MSDDCSAGSITRIVNGVSSASVTLLNQNRKYDGMFTPMDKITIYLRRLRRMLVFSGYLDSVPLFQGVPGSLSLQASCTLKRLQNFLWDPNTAAANHLFFDPSLRDLQNETDGGLAKRTIVLLNEVVGWPKAAIHIGAIPDDWFSEVRGAANRVIAEAEAQDLLLAMSGTSWLGGESPAYYDMMISPEGIGPGTGRLPDYQGRISWFGGPNGGAPGNMALTGESGTNPDDPWYCAMRWPYYKMSQTGDIDLAPGVSHDDAVRAQTWWKNRKIIVMNPRNNRGVVLRAADWGPATNTGRVIDVSKHVLEGVLKAHTDSFVRIGFAPEDAELGPIKGSALGQVLQDSGIGGEPIDWGQPGQAQDMVTVSAAGCSFTVNKMAQNRFVGFVNELKSSLGYHPKSIGGYSDRHIAGSSQWSNHAWGAAIDIDPTRNPRYSSAAGGPYALPHPPAIINLARKWGLYWGGEYNNSKDYMHFEVIGAPSTPLTDDSPRDYLESASNVVEKWVPPFKNYITPITNGYGEPNSGYASGHHTGTDFNSIPEGDWVHPVGPGIVDRVDVADASYGNAVGINHGSGVYTYYAHMRDGTVTVSVGDDVTSDTRLGREGDTGNARGVHLHLELRLDSDTYTGSGEGLSKANDIAPYLLGGPDRLDPPRGVSGSPIGGAGAQQGGQDPADIGAAFLNVWQWIQNTDYTGMLLTGIRGLMNDTPILGTVEEYMGSSMRDFCSAPNGDFIAWFPDYFGHYEQAGKMVVSPIEIEADPGPAIGWSDDGLKTHWFVTSSTTGVSGQSDASSLWQKLGTAGIASVEFPELMHALFKMDEDFDSEGFLARYGARVAPLEALDNITGHRQEFFMACRRFMENWSAQYSASVAITFMPELFPGMLMCLPTYGIQGYVREVSHSWNVASSGAGFKTTVSASPWSSIGKTKGFPGLPRGAAL